MKKAFDALTAQTLSYEFHDYKKLGIDENTLYINICINTGALLLLAYCANR